MMTQEWYKGGVVFAVLFEDSTVFLAGLGFAVFFFGKEEYFLVVCVIFGWENMFNCLFKTRPEDAILLSSDS